MAKNFKPPYAHSHEQGLALQRQMAKAGAWVSDEAGNSKFGTHRVTSVDEDANRKTRDPGDLENMNGSKPLPKV